MKNETEKKIDELKKWISKIGLTPKYFAELYAQEEFYSPLEEDIEKFYQKFLGHLKRDTTNINTIKKYLRFLYTLEEFKNIDYVKPFDCSNTKDSEFNRKMTQISKKITKYLEKPKVIISACLLGHLCRYDGKTKKTTEIVDAFKDYEIIPFCPEAPLFGTPRERISVIKINDENRIITDNTNRDITALLEDEINSFIKLHPNADEIVLKSKSPSCGLGTTPILNPQKEKLHNGNGIAAEIFQKNYHNTIIEDENNYV